MALNTLGLDGLMEERGRSLSVGQRQLFCVARAVLSSAKVSSLKFIYSEKATKFCEIFTLLLTTVHKVKRKVKILQNFVTFSEYMNCTTTPTAWQFSSLTLWFTT